MQTLKQIRGKRGEEMARDYLDKAGYRILQSNYRWRKSEIDLICRKDDILVFVEVKTRGSVEFGMPESFVTKKQIRKIQLAAENYIMETGWEGPLRFDIMAIVLEEDGTSEIIQIQDAF